MESVVRVTSCRSRELLFYSPTAAYGFPVNLCVGPRSIFEMTYASSYSLRSRIEICTLAGCWAAPSRRSMECVSPGGRVSKNMFCSSGVQKPALVLTSKVVSHKRTYSLPRLLPVYFLKILFVLTTEYRGTTPINT